VRLAAILLSKKEEKLVKNRRTRGWRRNLRHQAIKIKCYNSTLFQNSALLKVKSWHPYL
jgi:hypothetical protein